MNVLMLSAGRRVELINLFKQAAVELKIDAKLVAADCSELAPALYFADEKVILPRISNPNYIEKLIEACNEHDIKLVIPTIDYNLLLLAEKKDYIEAKTTAKVLISNYNVINICRDKKRTAEYLAKNGFNIPKVFQDKKNVKEFPVFIKPVSGSSSIDSHIINNQKDLDFYTSTIKEYILQEYIDGEEYTVDVFLDFDSNIITTVPRLRMATRGGEILQGKICKDMQIISYVNNLMHKLKPIGQITVQLIKNKNEIKIIEVNPRFGGGAPMSIQSGANSCKNLFLLLHGKELGYSEEFEDGQVYLRFDNSIYLNEGNIK